MVMVGLAGWLWRHVSPNRSGGAWRVQSGEAGEVTIELIHFDCSPLPYEFLKQDATQNLFKGMWWH